MVLSNKRDLVEYFDKGVVKTENEANSIAASVEATIDNRAVLGKDVSTLKQELCGKWRQRFQEVNQAIKAIEAKKLGGARNADL